MADNTLTRIYQGRVKQVIINGNELLRAEGEELVWKHHELFQDAVNYYMLALAGMADPSKENTPVAKFRKAMELTWDAFIRNGVKRSGMRESIARSLQCSAEKLTFDDAINKILGENHTQISILNVGLENIATSLGGDVVQPAGKYLPQLCSKDFKGNFDFSSNMNEGRLGIAKMLELLQISDPTEAQKKFNEIKDDIQLTWVGQKTQNICYSQKELQKLISDIVDYFVDLKNSPLTSKEVVDAIDSQMLSLMRGRLSNINRTDIMKMGTGPKNTILVNATILLICFGDASLLKLIKTQIKTIENKRKDWGEVPCGESSLLDDPIKIARGSKGYVFRSFTNLPIWNSQWFEFDKEAFVEALKTLNQFQQKISERQKELDNVMQCLKWMNEGISANGKPPKLSIESDKDDDESATGLPVLKNDRRWIQLQKILTDSLKIQNELTNDEIKDYGISERTIRGAAPIFKEWNAILKKGITSKTEKDLRDVLARYQKENSQTMGSAPLFMELTKAENFCIWDENWKRDEKYSSKNILEDAVTYYELCEDAEFLNEPIKFSPADALYSRRLSNFKVLSGQKQIQVSKSEKRMTWGTGYGLLQDVTRLNVPLAIRKENGKIGKAKATLFFSAPRLLRDQLINGDTPVYCPPIAYAFNSHDESRDSNEQEKRVVPELRDAAVQLMPDYDRKGKLRLLLNFQPSVNIEDIRRNCESVFPDKFFYGGKDEKYCLHWPDYGKKESLWCDSSEAFDIVAVDLGQRTAGALSRLRISPEASARSIFIGNDGEKNWFATQIYGGLLRLAGEDCRLSNNKEELSGSSGRLATAVETDEAKSIATEILGDEGEMQEFLVTDMTSAGELIFEKYFPVQNDKLLRVLKRGIYRLRQLARWHYLCKNGEDDKALEEAKASVWLPEKTLHAIQQAELKLREILKTNLLRMTERILPLRGRHWELRTSGKGFVLSQTIPSPFDSERWICGQRGLSFQRLEQLENLRHCFQSINRILMDEPGSKKKSASELRGISIPDCCPDILMRLDELKEQRVNQTANMILAQAMGVRHKEHEEYSKSIRKESNVHGEYEKIPDLSPAKFIVIENLSRYKFSQGRSRFENSRLMKWSHRAIRDKLKMLCEVYGITVVEVNAGYSSKFSPEGIPGFRAEEIHWKDVRRKSSLYRSLTESNADDKDLKNKLDYLISIAAKKDKTILLPKLGGPVFVPFVPVDNDKRLSQADINASYNLGLRAVAHASVMEIHHKLTVEKGKNIWKLRNTSDLSKKIMPKSATFEIDHNVMPASDYANLFVCECACRELGLVSAMSDGGLEKYNGKMMIGASIWKNRVLEVKRCLEINRKRMI